MKMFSIFRKKTIIFGLTTCLFPYNIVIYLTIKTSKHVLYATLMSKFVVTPSLYFML